MVRLSGRRAGQLAIEPIIAGTLSSRKNAEVEHSLTPLGRELGPLLESMPGWGGQAIDGRAGTARCSSGAAVRY
jgi:DNA-binding HxlR family transcriptional regulator